MSHLTRRIHLNTNHADPMRNENNHNARRFPLQRGKFGCYSDQTLSISTLKAIIPFTVALFENSEYEPLIKIVTTDVLTGSDNLTLYATDNKTVRPVNGGGLGTFISFNYRSSIEDILGIFNEQLQAYGVATTLIGSDSNNIVVASNATDEVGFDNRYWSPLLNSPLYRRSNERLARILGINTNTTELFTILEPHANATNRIVKWPMSMYLPPLLLNTDLSTDSVSSNTNFGGGIISMIMAEPAITGVDYEIDPAYPTEVFESRDGNIVFQNSSNDLSHKKVASQTIETLNLSLVSTADNIEPFIPTDVYYELEVKTNTAL